MNEVATVKKVPPMVYLAGDMLNKGSQMQRTMEREFVEELGYRFYNPLENKEINDKQNCVQEKLAQRIVKHDTDAIIEADIIVAEPLAHALGTNIELGQVKGMKDMAKMILDEMKRIKTTEDNGWVDVDSLILEVVEYMCRKMIEKKVLVHYSDIRRHNIPEVGDERSLGIHQYAKGVIDDITDDVGIMEWYEVEYELKQLIKQY